MLLKPTFGSFRHGGGKQVHHKFAGISDPLAMDCGGSARLSRDDDAQVTGLEVFPASATLKPGAEQQIVVRARYSDGRVRDVTRWTRFSSSDEGVASVNDSGHVKNERPRRGRHHAVVCQPRALRRRVWPRPMRIMWTRLLYTRFERHKVILTT